MKADNVVLLLDLSRKSEEALINNPDDEHRVFYVGATRAEELWLVRSETDEIFGGNTMRVVFQDGIIYASYTDKEVDNIAKHKHALIEMTPQELRLLHDDVTNVVTDYWRQVSIDEELSKLRSRRK